MPLQYRPCSGSWVTVIREVDRGVKPAVDAPQRQPVKPRKAFLPLEALASGLPVAAFPVPGPLDVIDGPGFNDGSVGVLDEDLRAAALAALEIESARCRAYALGFSWKKVAQQFLDNLAPRAGRARPLLPLERDNEIEALEAESEVRQVAEV